MLAQQCSVLSARFVAVADESALGADLSSAAFALIIHGEIEHAVEDIMMEVASAAFHLWKQHAIVTYPLAALMWAKRKGEREPATELNEGPFHAFHLFEEQVKRNHGVRQGPLEQLGRSLGIRFPVTVLGQLERFSSVRGELAHSSSANHVRTIWSIDDMVALAEQVQAEIIDPLSMWLGALRSVTTVGDDRPPALLDL